MALQLTSFNVARFSRTEGFYYCRESIRQKNEKKNALPASDLTAQQRKKRKKLKAQNQTSKCTLIQSRHRSSGGTNEPPPPRNYKLNSQFTGIQREKKTQICRASHWRIAATIASIQRRDAPQNEADGAVAMAMAELETLKCCVPKWAECGSTGEFKEAAGLNGNRYTPSG